MLNLPKFWQAYTIALLSGGPIGLPFYFYTKNFALRMNDYLMNIIKRQPVSFQRGEGVWLWDDKGTKYLDALSGLAVCGLGHAHKRITEVICQQAGTLLHTTNIFHIENQEILAKELVNLSGLDKAYFGNSGAEANEAAIKLARMYGNKRNISTPTIIVAEQSFHGRTLATLSATGNRKVQAGFEPLVSGFARVPFNDIESIEQIANNNSDIVAVLVEPIQGEGGINIPDDDYLVQLRKLCDEHKWLLMLDEIQSGMGRTGTWFAYQHHGILPDVISLAKGLGNGIPIGACIARGEAAELFQPGNHGTTFGGNPFACKVAHTVLQVMQEEALVQHAAEIGQYLLKILNEQIGQHPLVHEIRGKGLMIGIQLVKDCADLVGMALQQGFVINVTAGNVIRLLPPLIIQKPEIDLLAEKLLHLLNLFGKQHA